MIFFSFTRADTEMMSPNICDWIIKKGKIKFQSLSFICVLENIQVHHKTRQLTGTGNDEY